MPRFSPDHLLSTLAGKAANSKNPLLSKSLIRLFRLFYNIDMASAQRSNVADYDSFNDFFTRTLRPELRPVAAGENMLTAPADGRVTLLSPTHGDMLIQAKNRFYSMKELLGSEEDATIYRSGSCLTIYLAPGDYHRVHMPLSGQLTHCQYIAGSLFPVNGLAVSGIQGLFPRNERLICHFLGTDCRFAVVFVAALIVGGIKTVWQSEVCSTANNRKPTEKLELSRGDELGQFQLGSTVIVLCDRPFAQSAAGLESATVQMGQQLAELAH